MGNKARLFHRMANILKYIVFSAVLLTQPIAGSLVFAEGEPEKSPRRLNISSTFGAPYIMPPTGGEAWQKLKKIEAALGVEFYFSKAPAARSLAMARNSILDGGLWSVEAQGPEYAHMIRLPYVFATMEVSVFSWWPNMKIEKFDDLHDYYGFVASTQIGRRFLEKKIDEFENRLLVESVDQLFNLLASRRSDIVFLDRGSAYAAIGDRLGKTIFEVSSEPLGKLELYLYMRDTHAALIPEIMKALKQGE